ncbi:hypothetical protein RJT34_05879 [Clitoria ternatea]|uniref:non-specific serine/threonine protein kinase n=1 Tax=Clitoria ternatea TaxID=43366 RepID=A0AAN9PTZ7_CLITE
MSSPHNSSPDDKTPDNATPDDADNSSSPPPSSPPPPSQNSSPPPSKENSSPPPPPKENSSPPPPKENSSPPPTSPSPPPPSNNSPPPSPPSNNPSPPSPKSSSQPSPPPTTTPSTSKHSPPSFKPPSPPHKSLKSPNSHSSSQSKQSRSSDNSNKVIIGVVLGVGCLLLIVVIVCVILARRKKKKKRNQMYYYGDPSYAKGNNYYSNGQNNNYYGGPHGEHVVRVQNGMGHNGGGWGAPPPPPPLMHSADMSSNYSMGPPPLPPPSPSLALGLKGGTFSYEELAAATNGFSDANLIGQGGFGYVHKGVLPNGKEVAVKSLKSGSGQGEREFQAEIDIISRVHHRHLVSLSGYCIAGGQRMLVYEFIPNQTLEYHLHAKGRPTMDWPTRMRIALGCAKGFCYLHEDCHPRIIHRDIKAANVLIDDSFEAKVADFGLAKLTTDNNTHVSTRVMGTFGYLAPEYASSGKLTEKSDVFSFGVMLLELITGRRPVDHTNAMDDSLVDWARPLLTRGLDEDGNFGELVDPFLEGNYNPQELQRMAACAAASIRHSAKKRPKMSQIVRILEGDVSLDDLKDGVRRGNNSAYTSSSGSTDHQYDTMQYNADLQKFRKTVFSSSEFGNSSSSSGELSQKQQYH